MSLLDTIKEHPLPAAGIGLAVFVVVYFATRSSGSPATSYIPVSTGPSDAVQEASIAASVQQSANNSAAQQSAQALQANYNLGVLQLQSNDQAALIGAQVSNTQTSASEDIAMQQLKTQESISNTGVAAQEDVALAGYQTQSDINKQNQSTQQLQIQTSADTAQQQLQAETSMYNTGALLQSSLAQTAAGVINGQTSATLQTNLAQLALSGQESSEQTQLDTTAINDQTNLNSQYLNELGDQSTQYLSNQQTTLSSIEGLISSGTLNKGGEGGANQIAALQLLQGATPNPYPTATASLSGGNTPGGIVQSLSSLFASVGNGIAGGLRAS